MKSQTGIAVINLPAETLTNLCLVAREEAENCRHQVAPEQNVARLVSELEQLREAQCELHARFQRYQVTLMQGRQRMRSLNRLKLEGIIVPVAGHHRIVTKEIKRHRINGTHVGPPLLSVDNRLKLLMACSARGCNPVWAGRCVTVIRMVNTKEERPTPLTGSSLPEVVCCNSGGDVVVAVRKERCCQWQHFSAAFCIPQVNSAAATDALRRLFIYARKFAGQQLLMSIHINSSYDSVNRHLCREVNDDER